MTETTATELLSPDEMQRAQEVEASASEAEQQAAAIEVRTPQEAEQAMELVAGFAQRRKAAEEARTFLVKPLNDHVRAINDRFRPGREALERAEKAVKDKILAFRREEQRKAAEEQARLDAERRERERAAEEERRAAEAQARAEREAAAREAARAEAEAAAAERRRREQLEADAHARRTRIAKLGDESLRRIAEGGSSDAPMAQEELDQRRAAREAQERAAAARQAEEEARRREQEAREAPAEPVPATVATVSGPLVASSGRGVERKRWVATVVDAEKVPRTYLVVDQRLINAAVKDGVREIPGVKIEQQEELAIRGRR